MPNLLGATWSVSVKTDAGTIRRSGTDMESLADFIDELCDKGIIDFDTSVEADEDDDLEDDDENGEEDDPLDDDGGDDGPPADPDPALATSADHS